MQRAIPATVMRGGTSKGLYFLSSDLPAAGAERDRLLLAAMGSPDERQIDGMGGAHPLTSKVAIVSPSDRPDADIDYLFLQIRVDRPMVSDVQNCGNLLSGVGPFAIEKGLVKAGDGVTEVRIHMLNSGGIAIAQIQTPGGVVTYEGDASIDGVPGRAAPVLIDFADVAGSNCGSLLPTGNERDEIDGVTVTCIDNGMPVVILGAEAFGLAGDESPAALEANASLKASIEAIRLRAGLLMNLGDVANKTVPKMTLVSPPRAGGTICTRTFIPHRVHQAIGVLGAASVAAACCIPGSTAHAVAAESCAGRLYIEHPSGRFAVEIDIGEDDGAFRVRRSALLRTARKLMDGAVYVPDSVAAC